MFAATKEVCARLGWDYGVVDAPERVLAGNVRWLAGYRHDRHRLPEVAAALRARCAAGATVAQAAESVGEPVAVLPVLFHLMWRGELTTDLTVSLHPHSVLGLSEARHAAVTVALDPAA